MASLIYMVFQTTQFLYISYDSSNTHHSWFSHSADNSWRKLSR